MMTERGDLSKAFGRSLARYRRFLRVSNGGGGGAAGGERARPPLPGKPAALLLRTLTLSPSFLPAVSMLASAWFSRWCMHQALLVCEKMALTRHLSWVPLWIAPHDSYCPDGW